MNLRFDTLGLVVLWSDCGSAVRRIPSDDSKESERRSAFGETIVVGLLKFNG